MLSPRTWFFYRSIDSVLAALGLALTLSIFPGTVDDPAEPPHAQKAETAKVTASTAKSTPLQAPS